MKQNNKSEVFRVPPETARLIRTASQKWGCKAGDAITRLIRQQPDPWAEVYNQFDDLQAAVEDVEGSAMVMLFLGEVKDALREVQRGRVGAEELSDALHEARQALVSRKVEVMRNGVE